jgi:transposase
LTAEQVEEIRKMYTAGAQAFGFASDRWTTAKLAEAIHCRFGIRYDQDHVGRLLHKFGLRQRRFVYAPAYVPSAAAVNSLPA